MYCKHCGNQIADDSVFCSRCGKLVIESNPQPSNQPILNNEVKWVSTDNLQWKKPIVARCIQIILLVILGLFFSYLWYCFISGGEEHVYNYRDREAMSVYVKDTWGLDILKFTSVSKSDHRSYTWYAIEHAHRAFRTRIFFLMIPFIALIWLVIRWMQGTRFPGEKDIVPRDVADEIEQYDWDGFTRCKYIFFKKDGKYGIIDACNYCVNVPAQYDSIVWRMPNKTFDVTIEDAKQTLAINKLNNSNYSKTFKTICVFITVVTFVCTIFAIISDINSNEELTGKFLTVLIILSILTFLLIWAGPKAKELQEKNAADSEKKH